MRGGRRGIGDDVVKEMGGKWLSLYVWPKALIAVIPPIFAATGSNMGRDSVEQRLAVERKHFATPCILVVAYLQGTRAASRTLNAY